MNQQGKLNEAAGYEVMGWHRNVTGLWYGAKGHAPEGLMEWNPYGNWQDTRLVIREMKKGGFHFSLFFGDGDPEATFEAADDRKGYYQDPDELIAITTAAIIAKGGLGALPIEGGE